jgi:hypothetical protein
MWMSYFPDLSEYNYGTNSSETALNVGWLDDQHDFAKGYVEKEVCEKLLELCSCPVRQTRGYHRCPLCRKMPISISWRDRTIMLGSAEIRIVSKDGAVFAAPDLIYHYITAHAYCPPAEFLAALSSND